MKTISRFISAAILATLTLGASAGLVSAETWRFATKQPPENAEGKVFQYFANKVSELSNGDFTVEVYPSEQLGSEAAILEQLQLGTIQLFSEDAFFLQKWVPDFKWTTMPFVFKDRAEWRKFMGSDLVKGWFAEVEKTVGIRSLGDPTAVERGPYRVLLSKIPVNSLKDVSSLQLRMYPDHLAIAVWSHLGADLRMLSWNETYEGLKSGIANAVTSPIALVETMRHYEVAPYIARTNEYWQGLMFAMNAAAFDRLSPENQQILLKAHDEAAKYSQDLMAEIESGTRKTLEAKGVTFADLDTSEFINRMAEWYAAEDAAGKLPAGLLAAANAAKGE